MQETVILSDPACPLRIEYSKDAMEQIRRRARAGLMAAPRVGMAVGGLLLGAKDDSRIRVLNSVDLPCSHSTGPSFSLTPEEKRETTEMVAEANALSVTSKVRVVGWYCSKTRGDAVLSDSDRTFFDELFPGQGQLSLVLRPDVFETMRAAFFYRGQNGAVLKGFECEVDEWKPPVPDEIASAAASQDAVVELPAAAEPAPELPKVVEIRQPLPKPEPASSAPSPAKPAVKPSGETTLEDIIGLSAAEPAVRPPASPAYLSPSLGAPNFVANPKPSGKIRLTLAAVAMVIVLAVVAYFTRDIWYPRPPLSLTFSVLNGSLLIHWDPDSVRGIRQASMYVNDGGQNTPSVIPLDALQLQTGQVSYTPKSNRVTAKLDAGDISAFDTWVAPEQKEPDKPVSDPSPQAAGAGKPGVASPAAPVPGTDAAPTTPDPPASGRK